jgi:hypothetical protein
MALGHGVLFRDTFATAAGAVPQYDLGLAREVLLAAGRPADGLAHLNRAIAAIDEPGSAFIYLKSIVCTCSHRRRQQGAAFSNVAPKRPLTRFLSAPRRRQPPTDFPSR